MLDGELPALPGPGPPRGSAGTSEAPGFVWTYRRDNPDKPVIMEAARNAAQAHGDPYQQKSVLRR